MLHSDEVVEVTQAVWLSVLGEELEPVNAQPDIGTMLSGCVTLSGAFEGAVTVDCASALARTVTGAMFEVEPNAAGSDDVADAVGEIANMIGGNIKALLPGPSHLSLPTVTREPGGLTIPGTAALLAQSFRYCGEVLTVTVLQRSFERRSRWAEPGDDS